LIVTAYSLFDGVGKPSLTFKIKVFNISLFTVFSLVGIKLGGVNGLIIGMIFCNALVLSYAFYKLTQIIKLKIFSVISRAALILVPLFVSLVVYYPVLYSFRFASDPVKLSILVGYFIVFFFIFWLIGRNFNRGAWNTIKIVFYTLKIVPKGARV
jgi:O-antigen/teichoic acid export membrane protein